MPLDLKLDSNKIFHKVFEGTKPGYNALQVDTFLDIVIKDYEAMEKYVKETDQTIDSLNKSNKILRGRLEEVEASKVVLEDKLKSLSDNDNATLSNLELLKKISNLENALFKAGIDPKSIR